MIVFTSVAMVGVLTMTALVTDLGYLRVMRRSNQTLADLAASAAGEALGEEGGPYGRQGCLDAVRYLRLNADALAGLSLDCGSLPEPCDDTTAPATVTSVQGQYEVSITYPVSDAMISDPRVTGGVRSEDGEACERLEVSVERTEAPIFAGIVGLDELSISASAVVRQISEQNRRVPSLWLLDPTDCDALSVQGGAKVTVGTSTIGGLISLDSDGTGCGGTGYTVDVGGSGSLLQAIPAGTDPPGAVSLFAMEPGQATCATGDLHACDPSDVAGGTLLPQPVRRPWRATRAPVDHTFNCEASYPDYFAIAVAPCEDAAAGGDYIDQLRTGVGAVGTVPAGFNVWSSFHSCNPSGVIVVSGNWVVDCSDFKLNSGDVTFSGGNVIFDGSISLSSSGRLTTNTANTGTLSSLCLTSITGCLSRSSAGASWAYMRSGNLRLNGGNLVLNNTMLYQHNGTFTINGSAPPVWGGPTEGPFAGLSVWSEKLGAYKITGGSSMELRGIFFTPYADPFTLSGGAPFNPQEAQFISYRAKIDGGGTLELVPNSTHAISIPAPPVTLIR